MATQSTTPIPYSATELLGRGSLPPRTGRQLDQIAFPLGGIGTGTVSLGGWGQLRDWEIRNRPAKGFAIPQAFFMLKCGRGERAVTKILQGPIGGSFVGDGHTLGDHVGQGLPRFREAVFDGTYPIAKVALRDEAVPLRVELEAFNPLIPLNDRDSGIPVAILIYRLTNPTRRTIPATIFGNLTNIIGDPSHVQRVNRARRSRGVKGLWLATDPPAGEDPTLGTMALATPLENVGILPRWHDTTRHKAINHYWEMTALSDRFPPRPPRSGSPLGDTGTIGIEVEVGPGQTVEVPFLIAWHFPLCRHWHERERRGRDCTPSWPNWYAGVWRDAWDVAAYVGRELDRLRAETKLFRDTLFASTLPAVVLDAVSSQISTLRTPTCLRLADGTFYGFEGCSNTVGCCEGSCTHVWNYAQALPYLFPALQRSMREADWANSMLADGYVTFRMPLPLGTRATANFLPAADGQMGTVIQVYREWLISGDTAWLKDIWPRAKKALEFAWVYWDADRDGLMEGLQHNTYDNEFYGPNTMMGSLYLCALRAAEEMARIVGDDGAADEYRRLFESGSKLSDERLYNGAYYEQEIEPDAHLPWPERQRNIAAGRGMDSRFSSQPAWQFGKGCLSDQLIGQWYADMLGLGDLYDRRHVRTALRAIFKHNWRPALYDHPCTLRVYAVGDEAGLVIASWPRGERPGDPFWFADEVWCGIEYQVASHLIYEGLVTEGLAIVKGVRDRYTGERRNPWSEIECGHHYVRSMASYALLWALSGFHYHAADKRLTIAPRIAQEDFKAFFSVASGWGLVSQKCGDARLTAGVDVRYGELRLAELEVACKTGRRAPQVTARLGRRNVAAKAVKVAGAVKVAFGETVAIQPGARLKVTFDDG